MAEENKPSLAAHSDSESSHESLPVDGEAKPGVKEIFRQAFDKAKRQNQPANRSGLGRDRGRSMLLLGVAAVVVLLLFFMVFSSPNHPQKQVNAKVRGAADLGRRTTPGDASSQAGSSTPLMNAQVAHTDDGDTKQITATDVNNTAKPMPASSPARPDSSVPISQPKGIPAAAAEHPYALGQIEVADLPVRERAAQPTSTTKDSTTKEESDDLRKPSLVFVRNVQSASGNGVTRMPTSVIGEAVNQLELPTGTHLVARLESVVTSAVKTPVVASIEYNYERDGEIIVPAGAKAVGTLQDADRYGNVGIRFSSMQMPDGTTQKIDGTAMSLSYGPLKGTVNGKRSGTNFLVRTFTGLGQAATYLVGGGLGAPLSESAFLRDRIATNIGTAGDQELSSLTFNQNIVVTVPGNTRFYLVMAQDSAVVQPQARPTATQTPTVAQPTANPPSLDELRQLLQLRQEMNAMYQQTENSQAAAQPAPQQ
jgi:hypothetical protein